MNGIVREQKIIKAQRAEWSSGQMVSCVVGTTPLRFAKKDRFHLLGGPYNGPMEFCWSLYLLQLDRDYEIRPLLTELNCLRLTVAGSDETTVLIHSD